MFECPICKNKNILLTGELNGLRYCRKCISFSGRKAQFFLLDGCNYEIEIDYPLSPQQEIVSDKILFAYQNNKNVLLNAVCGAGKTELVCKAISYAIKNKKQIGFAIPRKDVVIDLLPRFKKIFPHKKIIAVYGDNTDILEGDIILLTTHQLYRYEHYFDLLILDEVDAFPYFNDEVLKQMMERSLKGNYIMMSATSLDKPKDSENVIYLTLNKRYHGFPLPVPKVIICPWLQIVELLFYLSKFIKKNYQIFIFVPTIEMCEYVFRMISTFFKNGEVVHSKKINRDKIIEDFKKAKYKFLVTTSILERGVTVENLQVIVYQSHHIVYDKKTLIQIAGRVGRKNNAPRGDVIFLCDYKTEAIEMAVKEIERANKNNE